ncbi:hypothetical protein TB2_028331 [Malus domestica]
MTKIPPLLATQVIVLSLLSSFSIISVQGKNPGVVRTKLLGLKKEEKLSHFRLYWHDIVSGPNPSSVAVVKPVTNSSTGFGFISMIDDPLTEGPEMSSKLLGRAQGFYGSASQKEAGLLMAMNFAFIQGKYNGSTITVLGRSQVFNKVREMPVIGGSGLFRFAGGYVEARTHYFNLTTGDAIVETPQIVATQFIILSLLSSFALILVQGDDQDFVRALDRKLLGLEKEKFSHFKMYWHDIVGGPNPSSVPVVNPPTNSSTAFGLITMIDNPLTEGPELTSKLLGKSQGFYSSASQKELGLLMAMNFHFIQGKYNGSTITILGRNQVFNKVREMPVVGGSGLFRFARGYAEARTHTFTPATGDATVEYNIYVLHY